MIGYLIGTLFQKETNKIILLVHGVGYEIYISLSTLHQLKEIGAEQALFIYTIHKEDTFHLYGFSTEKEKDIFKLLISITGIGPKMALSILSHVEIEILKKAVIEQDTSLLTQVGGIGKKRAEKLIFELKERFDSFIIDNQEGQLRKDIIQALENLGYSYNEAANKVNKIKLDTNLTLEDLLKKALHSQ